MKNSISALARMSEHIDLFFVHPDGRMNTAWWRGGIGWSDTFSIGGFFPAKAAVASVARMPEQLDIFVIGNDGQMYTSWWHEGQDWSGANDNWLCLGGSFPPGASVAAVARQQNHLDVFAVGNDGRMYSAWWHEGMPWSGFFPIGGFFPSGAVVSAVARIPEHLDVFVIGNDGRVFTSWWHDGQNWSGANDNWLSIGGFFPNGGSITAVSRVPDRLDVFVMGNDGRVFTSWWIYEKEWSGINDNWLSLGGFFPTNAVISATSRHIDVLDLFVIGNDGRVYTSWWRHGQEWSGANNNWLPIGGFFPNGGSICAVSRHQDNLDVFTIGNDGKLYTSWWQHGKDWSGANDNWFQIQNTQGIRLHQGIVTGGIDALGGWVDVTIHRDGNVRFSGHIHDSGIEDYDFLIRAIVYGDNNTPIALQKSGSVEGTESALPFGTADRDFDWDETTFHPEVALRFDDLKRSIKMDVYQDHEGNISGKLEDIANLALRWVGGAALINPLTGLIIFAGAELYSLASTGSLIGGARIIAGTLWLAGPWGTLYALAAEGIAQIGENERELWDHEYEFAKKVFGDQLPPRDKIKLTDTIGAGNRAFCFPRFDGKITVNMGVDGFNDPLNYRLNPSIPAGVEDSGKKLKAVGETFIHELTHVWQIHHTNWDLALLADALSSKVCEATGGHPYDYGNEPNKPFHEYNLEQQGDIVSDWFSGHKNGKKNRDPMDINSPYYHYIEGNIRTGRTT